MEKISREDAYQIIKDGAGNGIVKFLETLDNFENNQSDKYGIKTMLGKDQTCQRTMKRLQMLWHTHVLDDECYTILMMTAYKERLRDFASEGKIPMDVVDSSAAQRIRHDMVKQHVGYMKEHHVEPVELYGR